MNDFSELEGELKKLRPRAASVELRAAIRRELTDTPTVTATAGVMKARRRMSWNWLPLGLGIAGAAAFLLLARVQTKEAPRGSSTIAAAAPRTSIAPANSGGSFVPAGVTQVVYSTRDEGLHFSENASMPMRRIRSRKRETLRWQNPETGASLRVTYPSEEVVLTPISGQ